MKKASTINDMSQFPLRKLIESLDDDDDLDKLGKEDFFCIKDFILKNHVHLFF